MAGENVVLLSAKGMVSIHYVATAAVKKGDLIKTGHCIGFALHDAARGETLSLCVEADLVEIDIPRANRKKHAAGTWIHSDPAENMMLSIAKGHPLNRHTDLIGVLHDATVKADTKWRLVYKGD